MVSRPGYVCRTRSDGLIGLTIAALEDNPTYTKALQRRAMANEAIGSWSSLSAALEGEPSRSSQFSLPRCSDVLMTEVHPN